MKNIISYQKESLKSILTSIKEDEMMDRADYEYDRQRDDKAERYFNALNMLKEMRKDTPLREFSELIKELLTPDEVGILIVHLNSKRTKQI